MTTLLKRGAAGMLFLLILSSCSWGSSPSNVFRGANAPLNFPSGVAFDIKSGALYITNTYSCTVGRLSSTGHYTTVAGKANQCGYADGKGSEARFFYPAGITYVDASNQLAITDTQNCTIRLMSPSGMVSTLAGSNLNCAFADGQGNSAFFFYPSGIAYDDAANALYVTDTMNCAIRKVTFSGVVTTVAGSQYSCRYRNGNGAHAAFRYPSGITYDNANGSLYVTDTLNCAVRKVDPSGDVTTIAGGPGKCTSADGPGAVAGFAYPTGIDYLDKAHALVVTDTNDCSVRAISSSGVTSTIAGSIGQCGFSNGLALATLFSYPARVADNPETGALYITDQNNCAIRKMTFESSVGSVDSAVIQTLAGRPGGCPFAPSTISFNDAPPISGLVLGRVH